MKLRTVLLSVAAIATMSVLLVGILPSPRAIGVNLKSSWPSDDAMGFSLPLVPTRGMQIHEACELKDAHSRIVYRPGWCAGYIEAIWDVLLVNGQVQGGKGCQVDGNRSASNLERIRVVRSFLTEQYLTLRDAEASQSVAKALMSAYPCR